METLDPTEIAVLSAEWYNGAGVDTDPDTIVLTIEVPDGTTVTKNMGELVHDGPGKFHYDYVTTVEGAYFFEFNGQGTNASGIQGGTFLVGINLYDGPLEPWVTWAQVAAQPMLQPPLVDPAKLAALSAIQRELITDSVSELLFNLSHRIYPGFGETTRSLCVHCSACGAWWWWQGAYASGCSCAPSDRINIRGRYPVVAIRNVMVEGQVVDRANYRLEDAAYLVWLSTGEGWPRLADLTDPTGFQATWVYGRPIPANARRVAALLAGELTLAALSLPCLLPQYRISSIQSEGISYTIVDQTRGDRGKERIGFGPVDQWLDSIDVGMRLQPGGFDPGNRSVEARQTSWT